MEAYLADRIGQAMSSSTYLPKFAGGVTGAAVLHSSLSDALSGNGSYCRKYRQDTTSSNTVIQYETGGGAFYKSTSNSGNFFQIPSTKAVRMEMWVRSTGLTASATSPHGGSQVALVAKASSPYGHRMDHIKGYALKFGTFKDGENEVGKLGFRLSLRASDMYDDGMPIAGCGDIDVTNASVSTAENKWIKMRLDVIPAGHAYDQIKAYGSVNGTNWFQLGSTQNILRTDPRYRFWQDEDNIPLHRVRSANGQWQGFIVSLSSSTGHTVADTQYYVDSLKTSLDTVE